MQIIGLPAERKLQENQHFSQLIIESASRVCLPPAVRTILFKLSISHLGSILEI